MIPLTQCALLVANYCAVCLTGTCDLMSRAAPPPAVPVSASRTITVMADKPATIPEEALTVELVSVKDNRCAVEVQCVWAGYAEIVLRVSKGGGAPASVTIGTPAPPSNSAPTRTYDGYRFGLVSLEPPHSMAKPVAQTSYRATITVGPSGSN